MRKFRPYVPQNLGELRDKLGSMMIGSPTFRDTTGYFPEENVETTFSGLNDGIEALRSKLGEDRYRRFVDMSKQMRTYFEADPQDETGDATKGRDLILDMLDMLKTPRAK